MVRLHHRSINDTPLNGLAEPASDASAVDPHIGMLPRLHWKHNDAPRLIPEAVGGMEAAL